MPHALMTGRYFYVIQIIIGRCFFRFDKTQQAISRCHREIEVIRTAHREIECIFFQLMPKPCVEGGGCPSVDHNMLLCAVLHGFTLNMLYSEL